MSSPPSPSPINRVASKSGLPRSKDATSRVNKVKRRAIKGKVRFIY